jgi:hypothetical protein
LQFRASARSGQQLARAGAATAGTDLGIAYVAAVRPFPAAAIAALGAGDIVLAGLAA